MLVFIYILSVKLRKSTQKKNGAMNPLALKSIIRNNSRVISIGR